MITANKYFRDTFGHKMYKASIAIDVTCPNRDGSKGTGGCIFCSEGGSGEFAAGGGNSVTEQIKKAIEQVKEKAGKDAGYIAYFQSFTSTYAQVEKLCSLYFEALSVPDVVGLVISTRPDCLSDEILDLICSIDRHHRVIVEIGVETSHNRTLALINRCHSWQCAADTITRVASRGIHIGAHLILGLPGESEDDMMATVNTIAQLPISSVKFHQLQVLRGTSLAQQWESGALNIINWTPQQYASFCHRIINSLPERIVVERMVSTAPQALLLQPKWNLKPAQFREIFQNIL